MNRMRVATGLVIAGVCLGGATVLADLDIKMRVKSNKVVQFERVPAFITIRNNGGEAFLIRADDPTVKTRLIFEAELGQHRAPQRKTDEPLVNACLILPGESQEIMAEVTQVYDFSTMGGYDVWAAVEWNGVRYFSNREHIDVVSGLPLKSMIRSVPGRPGAQRRYKLCYLTRKNREQLFLVVDELGTEINYGVFELGQLMRVHPPRMTIQADGKITVLHQSTPGGFTRSILQAHAEGVRFVDQDYQTRSSAGKRALDLSSGDDEPEAPKKSRWSWLPFVGD